MNTQNHTTSECSHDMLTCSQAHPVPTDEELLAVIEQRNDAYETIYPTSYIPQEPLSEADKIVVAINAFNRSVDKRLERLISALVNLARAIEGRG